MVLTAFLTRLHRCTDTTTLLGNRRDLIKGLNLRPNDTHFLQVNRHLRLLTFLRRLMHNLIDILLFRVHALSMFHLRDSSLVPTTLPVIRMNFDRH